jgi:hypothetical protein
MEGPFHEPSLAHPPSDGRGRVPQEDAAAAPARAGRPAGIGAGGVVEEWLGV